MLRAICLSLAALSTPALASDPQPVTEADFRPFDPDKARIGQQLFYDPILAGNRNISCGTCHHHDLGTTDNLSLGIGEGGKGIGLKRVVAHKGIDKRVPRNAPAMWNLGAKEITVLFHDGRLSVSDLYGNGFNSPAEERLPDGLPDILAAQAVFPLTAFAEMAGHSEENEVAGAVNDRIDNGWPIIAKRVRTIPEYGAAFVAAFDDVTKPEEVTIVHIASALSDFINGEWRSFDSPYDAHLGGDADALTDQQKAGLDLFFGKAQCATCHSGPFLTDQKFHALALPQFGPGRTRMFDPSVRDVGRMGESDRLEDAYRFRTPALRNVTLTAPYGHNGAYPTLEGILRHHLDPDKSFEDWTPDQARLPRADWLAEVDFLTLQDAREVARIRRRTDLPEVSLDDAEVDALLAFLAALEGGPSTKGRLGRPDHVPSGLTVDGS